MAYTKKLWSSGDYLTTEELNRMEDGIANYNGTTNGVKVCAGHANFPAYSSPNEQQFATITFPNGVTFSDLPMVTATWSARGVGGTMSRVNPLWVSEVSTTGCVIAWYTDGVALVEHHFDWIAVGV